MQKVTEAFPLRDKETTMLSNGSIVITVAEN